LPPAGDHPVDDLLGIRDLFREEARTILDRLRQRLPEIAGQLPDARGLADVVADGVALKGSGALVGLPVVSRAGVLIVRTAELAAGRAADDPGGAASVVESLRTSLGALEQLLDACLDRDDAAQDALLGDVLGHFPPPDRSLLRSAIAGEGAGARPEADGRGKPGAVPLRGETADGLVAAITELLVAEAQLGGIEREVETVAASLDPTNAGAVEPTAVLGELAASLAARAAPARALARAAGDLHRRLRELGLPAGALEPLVILHVGEARYALAADHVQAVGPAVETLPPDGAGRTTISLDGGQLPALDLGRCLGEAQAASSPIATVVEVEGSRFALLVARAEPPRVMVLRPLDPLLAAHPLLRDLTVGPRGQVVFVLRVEALLGVLQGRIELRSDSALAQPRA
jgi:chemotaxis protein histidine kinase CheA